MKAIITGADGNLGRRLRELAAFECLPVSRGDWSALNDIQTSAYQALIHCAYDLKNDINLRPDLVLESNAVSTGKALRVCREKGIGKFVFISSCSVYGDSSNTSENKPCQPVTINGFTKLFNEELVKSFCAANGIEYLILRVFNSYGGNDTFSVVHKLLTSAKSAKPFVLMNEGMAERDFIHVEDVAFITAELMKVGIANETINVGSGKSVRIADLLRTAEERYGPIAVTRVAKGGEAIYSRANIDRLRTLLDPQVRDVLEFIRGQD